MDRTGRTLAEAHHLAPGKGHTKLLARLDANQATLVGVCKQLTASAAASMQISPPGEWLLDNFHLIAEQIATAKHHLPREHSRELPHLGSGPSARLAPVHDLALETVSHGDVRIDAVHLIRFVAAYQSVTPLKLGELWAIPIMIRLALIENLRRVGVQIAAGREQRDLANIWADRMLETVEQDQKSLILVVADVARSDQAMEGAFVAELVRRG